MDVFSGFITLRIMGKDLNFEFLNSFIELEPGTIVKKGEKLRRGVALEDRWFYEMKFSEDDFSEKVSEFIDILNKRKDKIHKVKETATVDISFYISSEMAQFGYTLTAEQLKQLGSFGENIYFDLLSYGLVEKENGEMVGLDDVLKMVEKEYEEKEGEQM